jgi:hypothetical protein
MPVMLGENFVKHMLLTSSESRKLRKKNISNKWLKIKNTIAYMAKMTSTNKALIKNLGEYLDKVK